MAEIDISKFIPEKDTPIAGEDVFFDEANNVVKVKNAFGTSIYDPSGKLLYGKGALYDTNIGTTSGKNVQLFGRNQEIGGSEEANAQAQAERIAKEAAYGSSGTKGLINYLNTGVAPATGAGGKSIAQLTADSAAQTERQSAYDLLLQQFNQYGLGSLVEPLKTLITSNVSPSEFALRLQETEDYKKRFIANKDRINKGLRALTPAEYIGLEDQYQNIMRNYGLPASYYTKDSLGTQEGFNKFIGNDVSAAELEDRIATAQKRVINTNPEVLQALKQFYPDLNNSDILAYTLDPNRALEEIKRKVTAAEIGGAALAQGLQAQGGTAESLAGLGITKAQAQQGYQTIGEFLPSATKLGQIYQNPYDQATAEQEVFGTAGAATAAQRRKKLAQQETSTFSGQSGRGVLSEQRQGSAGAF